MATRLRRTWYVNRMDKVRKHSRSGGIIKTTVAQASTKQMASTIAQAWGLKDLGGVYYVSGKQCSNWVKRDASAVDSTDPWFLERDRDYTRELAS